MIVASGISSQILASRVADALGCELAFCEFKKFPDGEIYTRVDMERNEEAVVVQSIRSDADLMCLLQLIDAASHLTESVDVVIPYMGYARQDRQFRRGEAVSARVVARCVSAVAENVRRVFVVNVHSKHVLRYFTVPACEIDAVPLLSSYFSDLNDIVVIAPDKGAEDMAKSFADAIYEKFGEKVRYEVLRKRRISEEEVEIEHKALEGENAIIVDDIISTGGTIAEAASLLRGMNVFVACVHGIFVQNALLRMRKAGIRDIISTDTVESAFSKVSVAGAIADALRAK